MEINFIVSHMTELSLIDVFLRKRRGPNWGKRIYTWENTRCVVRFKRVLQIHILEGLPSKRYKVHQQRAPDLCGPTFQLITGYTPILNSRSQTSALKWQRPRPHASRGRSRTGVEVRIYTSSYVRHHVLDKTGTIVGYSSSPWGCC